MWVSKSGNDCGGIYCELPKLTLYNKIQVSVKDNGPGIEENQQSKILMPFHTIKTECIGLSISSSLIEIHDWKLNFYSQLGKGSTFYLRCPFNE
jgi:signal transduction histidine kinase